MSRNSGEQGPGPLQAGLLIVAMIAVGCIAWAMQFRADPELDADRLFEIPREIADWEALDVPLTPAVEEALGSAAAHVQRLYQSAAGGPIWLYIGYYPAKSGGRPQHTPRGCYPASGWAILESRVVTANRESGLQMNEYHVARPDGEEQLVHFWYRSTHRSGMLGGWDQNVDRFLSRLMGRRSDGALIRISTPIEFEGGIDSARSRLVSFGAQLDPLIGEHWPKESEGDRDS